MREADSFSRFACFAGNFSRTHPLVLFRALCALVFSFHQNSLGLVASSATLRWNPMSNAQTPTLVMFITQGGAMLRCASPGFALGYDHVALAGLLLLDRCALCALVFSYHFHPRISASIGGSSFFFRPFAVPLSFPSAIIRGHSFMLLRFLVPSWFFSSMGGQK